MSSGTTPAELTWRGLLLGGALTLLFTAANVYLGLKVGLTFATSIPAAVISMAVLRHLPGATVLENNIVQTVASAAGTLSAIIFVLPGLVMIGWWHGFPWLTTAGITATGGILGVMFSVPLRRALVVDSDLPYPEGRAAAEVLALGTQGAAGQADSALGLRILIWNSLASAGFAILAQTRLVLDSAATWFRVGAGATGIAGNLSFALLGVGHLVGLSVGAAMALGLVIAWVVLAPILTAQQPMPDVSVEAWVGAVFRQEVRFFGAGVMGVAAIWTLIRIARPVLGGIRSALAAGRARQAGATLVLEERDLPVTVVLLVSVSLLLPIGWLLWDVLAGTSLERHGVLLVAGGLLFVGVIGLVVAAVTGYMAGLIGASNSPVSGIGILAALASSAMLLGLLGRDADAQSSGALVAYVLTVTGIVFSICTIANDNLQDLKTGQLVGATPWKQQTALIVGVVFGSAIIPPVLNVLATSFGFVGTPGAGPNALAAPQAGLISTLAKGVLSGEGNWRMLGWGAAAGVGLVALDETLGRLKRLRIPPLAAAFGIYLPMKLIAPLVAGALIGTVYERWARRQADPERAIRLGTLTATGLIVGESLWGVAFALIVYVSGDDAALALVGDGFGGPALIGGLVLFVGLTAGLYRQTRRLVG
ncbi:putative OPT family oligopeptide transporter [Methylobacterium brachiatum]|uniref:OPT family oligopeptide transporter n=1 Tax=Methylobacterium brachiatum TaxID=269660 RepID=A0AAJ1TU56_9HYPH|nr:oligopeptide transporter, OPT family [Methylobacterium brachiatum]MCB4805756.1 oligopeptide transporter, OPT family [Methylobacterium brachiatum]MDQ0547016.1 putative OPT family oligopeptide transporter [Methylobacterium brachiatum]